ncbi:MAG: class I SAM-dependent methyltransferase [Pirellulaceae bacterium]|nr:class I SAM-dependent methyltransferase [Pirellulaceae bacterium]
MNLCYLIANRVHLKRHRNPASNPLQRRSSHDAYWQWQCETSPKYFDKFFDLREKLPDARVIDIGCGLGGRTCSLVSHGIRQVVGVDINQVEVAQAQEIMQRLGNNEMRDKIRFQALTEFQASSNKNSFDVALLVDSLEHVKNPTEILNQAHSMLRPGGVCYFSTWGWYHHQASHVGSIVPIPFATVFFSDKQILDAVRRVVAQPYYVASMWDSNPPALRWQDCSSLHDRPGEYLNKFTIRKFRKAMAASDFSKWELKTEGFSAASHRVLACFNFLSRIPIVQEVYHSAVFGRLTKADKS